MIILNKTCYYMYAKKKSCFQHLGQTNGSISLRREKHVFNGSMKFHSPNHEGHSDIRTVVGWMVVQGTFKILGFDTERQTKIRRFACFFEVWEKNSKSNKNTGVESSPFCREKLYIYTLPETNIAPVGRPSQKKTHLPTIDFQGLC